jgi:hypothetical protein
MKIPAPAQAKQPPRVAQTRAPSLADERPETVAQRELVEKIGNSARVMQHKPIADRIGARTRGPGGRKDGLPAGLRSGIESLSGLSMGGVRVHYDSPLPAQRKAWAHTQGTDIHVGPGQERHLPHEAWHVVQQAQGRVKPTLQMKGLAVNDDAGLEREADVMGAKAAALGSVAPISRPMAKPAAAPSESVAQMAWATQAYQVDEADRTLHVDTKTVSWGATADDDFADHTDDAARPRAILYETMGRPADVAGLLAAYATAPTWDVGLSLVVNRAFTPAKIYRADAKTPTAKNKTQGDTAAAVKNTLDGDWTALTNAWNGPALQITVAAWERREVEKDAGSVLEAVQGSVPYSTLRHVAAVNPGADLIDAELYTNHSSVWRKMGDSDMPIVGPNAANSAEITKLKAVEDEGTAMAKNTLVTFGYNLTTAGTTPMVTGILANIYKKEMALRDKIGEAGGPLYPSEPTTYYRPRAQGSMTAAWSAMEAQKVGGSGQQLEGAKLIRAMEANGGALHVTDHSIAADTAAGARNNALVALLEGWWNNGAGNHDDVDTSKIIAEINKLDQSALRDNEYLSKVPTNLGKGAGKPGALSGDQHTAIAKLVTDYRKAAAVEAAFTLVNALTHRM